MHHLNSKGVIILLGSLRLLQDTACRKKDHIILRKLIMDYTKFRRLIIDHPKCKRRVLYECEYINILFLFMI